MKKLFISMVCTCMLVITSLANTPNEKVLKAFESAFMQAENVHWTDYTDYYEVSFSLPKLRATIRYDQDGKQLNAKKYYDETGLPAQVQAVLKNKFPGKTIYGVTEITEPGKRVLYYVKMQDDQNWITVKITGNGQPRIYEKHRKA
jgi:hypothetical protein